MAIGDAAGAAGLTTYTDSLLVNDVDTALNQRGDDIAGALTRITALEAAALNTPKFSVNRSPNGQNVPDSAWTQMTANAWGTPTKNVGGFTWSGGQLTVPRAGVYAISGHVQFYADDFTTAALQVTRNSTQLDTNASVLKDEWSGPTKSGETSISPSASQTRLFVSCNVGDVLRFYVLQRNVNGQTWNTGTRAVDLTWDVLWLDTL